jgi:hypothetical protein
MKKNFYLISGLMLCTIASRAQLPEDAIRMSWNVPSGTARNQAIGGAMGSLGGELTSLFVNPAGLGFYKTGEIVLTPGFSFAKTKGTFLGETNSSDKNNAFNLGATGVVWGYTDKGSRWASKAFSIGVNRIANFNKTIFYKGTNDYSSFSEPLANEFFNFYSSIKDQSPGTPDATIIDNALNSPDVSLMTKQALYTYLIDLDSSNGERTVISRAELANTLNQQNRIATKGGITELAIGFAANMDDKLYFGGSLGVPIVNYERNQQLMETDANGSGNNEFNHAIYEETYTSKGAGINLKLGLIFKPINQLRLGLAIHTPTLYGLKDNLSSSMETDIDTAAGSQKVFSVKSSDLLGTDPEFRYDLVSPWKFMISGSYVIHEESDVRKQKGFITGDVEYVTHSSSRFSPADPSTSGDYYDGVNQAIRDVYKGAFNFRLGGELKFNTIMARLGFAWYGSPYDDKELKARKMNLSGGLGYRNKGMFVDLTYIQSLNRDVHFPYRLEPPRLNVYSNIKESIGNVLLTFGFKF